mmetsp:Transcript_125958/g.362221  ORF Transcript_125958/g.362221 Transcript_125958/m.362221 type:complete len:201 (-) Transcript_125958:2682-3284(-)
MARHIPPVHSERARPVRRGVMHGLGPDSRGCAPPQSMCVANRNANAQASTAPIGPRTGAPSSCSYSPDGMSRATPAMCGWSAEGDRPLPPSVACDFAARTAAAVFSVPQVMFPYTPVPQNLHSACTPSAQQPSWPSLHVSSQKKGCEGGDSPGKARSPGTGLSSPGHGMLSKGRCAQNLHSGWTPSARQPRMPFVQPGSQ